MSFSSQKRMFMPRAALRKIPPQCGGNVAQRQRGGRVRQTALPVIPQLRVLFHPNSTFIHKEPVFLLDGTAVLCYNANSFRFFRGSSLKRRRPFRPQDRTTPLSPLFLGACTVFAATPIRKCREPLTRLRFRPSQKFQNPSKNRR